ncbi:MAG: hypothetical protein UV53_C0035G0006 [Candidatus Azambacteria bacterium GW2011_GWE1_42_9]|nr:MAG: hypothetical protein UV53_C0035G0006 [Candidatus Azambacteria bacterium GW2011_GWE1_42_9]
METMKFGEPEASQEGENRKNTENNEPAPKAPERNNGVNNDGKRKKKLINFGSRRMAILAIYPDPLLSADESGKND